MITLGISGGHDANWCVLKDGVLLGAFQKERFTRIRHDTGEVLSLIPRTLKFLGISPEQIDLIATSEPVHKNTGSGIKLVSGSKYKRYDQWQHQTVEIFNRLLPCISVPHHISHAAYARYTSGFENTAVITWDGGGDFYTEDAYTSTTISSWQGANLEWIKRVHNSDFGSLWFTYSRAIFGDSNTAGKLMGLAALGSDKLVEQMTERFLVPTRGLLEGSWTIKNSWSDYYYPPFVKVPVDWQNQLAKDVAFAVQHLTNYAGLSIVERFRTITNQSNLALCGGVALNGYLNDLITRSGFFDNVFVPPAVDDGGIAVGSALFAVHNVFKIPLPKVTYPLEFNGMSYGEKEVDFALSNNDLKGEITDTSESVDIVAEALIRHQTVAWYEGRSEHGQRALGNRSILALPDKLHMRDKINSVIKFREEFRPIAPVVLEEDAHLFFEADYPSPFMMHIVKGKKLLAEVAPAAIHFDNTARFQTVKNDSSIGRLLKKVKSLTGQGILLNTSFNVCSPIVETPDNAIETFLKVPIDLLYLNGRIIRKKYE